ncbi:MAG: hypothetical protein JWR36_539 [Glaciihabitans sp.]|nr:hypothetical protein [Glaciihabitans sp.]MDQ1572164.1 hypothetical protein [Actinomycetota bacterium]
MDASAGESATNRVALLREQKDQMAIVVMHVCRERRIRALAGGGSVLTAQGLISPNVSRTLSLVVDPASNRHLVTALREAGWRRERGSRRFSILPPVKQAFVNDAWIAALNVFSVIPGFFADPEETFDLLWERRREVPVRGETIPGLDRLASAVLASHNSLDGRGPHAASHSEFFAEQFRQVLSDAERSELAELVRRVGGGGEMSSFLESLGVEPVPFTLPSQAYVSWRLKIDSATDQIRRAVALLELPRRGRQQLYESRSGRPRRLKDVWIMIVSLPNTFRAIVGAKRRWAADSRRADS